MAVANRANGSHRLSVFWSGPWSATSIIAYFCIIILSGRLRWFVDSPLPTLRCLFFFFFFLSSFARRSSFLSLSLVPLSLSLSRSLLCAAVLFSSRLRTLVSTLVCSPLLVSRDHHLLLFADSGIPATKRAKHHSSVSSPASSSSTLLTYLPLIHPTTLDTLVHLHSRSGCLSTLSDYPHFKG